MLTRTDFVNKIQELKKAKVGFNEPAKQYTFNDLWVDEITQGYFDKLFDSFQDDIYRNIGLMKLPKEVLIELYELLWQKVEWYENNNIHDFAFFNAISGSISSVAARDIYTPKNTDISIAFIQKFNYGDDQEYDDLVYTLKRYEEVANYTANPINFERVKLLHAMQLHNEFLKELYHFLYKLEMDFDTIDFNKIGLENSREIVIDSKKCNFKIDKISTAIFFGVLMKSGMISMDENAQKSDLKIKRFIEDHFTYMNDKGEITPIHRINKELSKPGKHQYRQKELEVLNDLIKRLETFREKIRI